MKKLWQAVMQTEKSGLTKNEIFLDVTDTSSPYGEATMKNSYDPEGTKESQIAVNPYYSYGKIFDFLIQPGVVSKLTKFLCDLILHHLCEIDSIAGMSRNEFYVRFLEQDMKEGVFGSEISFSDCTKKEIREIAFQYFRLYRTGNYELSFCKIVQVMFPRAQVNILESGFIVISLNCYYSEDFQKRIALLIDLFLPLDQKYRIYWEIPFGIIDCEETTVDHCVLF